MASKRMKTNGNKRQELSEEFRNGDGGQMYVTQFNSSRTGGIFIVHAFLVGFSAQKQQIGSSLDILKVTQNNELNIFNKSYMKI